MGLDSGVSAAERRQREVALLAAASSSTPGTSETMVIDRARFYLAWLKERS